MLPIQWTIMMHSQFASLQSSKQLTKMFIKNISLALLALAASTASATDTPALRVSNLFDTMKRSVPFPFRLNYSNHKSDLHCLL